MKELERLSWRCRRGMLELDIVLGRFVQLHYADLDDIQKTAFDVLLDMPDQMLWDMIVRSGPSLQKGKQCAVLELLRTV